MSALGIVVVSYQTRELLRACLASVARELSSEGLRVAGASSIAGSGASSGADMHAGAARDVGPAPAPDAGAPTAEVWVVDNASSDGSAEMVREAFPWVRLEALTQNVGFTAGNDLVLDRWVAGSPPEAVLLLNPDAELTPGSLGRLLTTLRAHPEAGAVGPALRYPDGRFQHAAFRFPGLVQTALDLWPIARLADAPINGRYPRRSYEAGEPFRVDFVLGACLLMSRDALCAVGPLDRGYAMYCEEVDWCKRAANAGLATLCEPRALVVHHGSASSRQRPAASTAHLWRSRLRWFERHASPAKARAIRALVRLGLLDRSRRDVRAMRRGEITASELEARGRAYASVFAEAGP